MAARWTIGFLGAGKMATALAHGFVRAGLVEPAQLIASDPAQAARAHFARDTRGRITALNREVLASSEVVFLAVKPNQVRSVLEELRPQFTRKHLLVSVAAGISLSRIEGELEAGMRVVRVMPNTPALVGASASAYALGRRATAADGRRVQQLLSAVGLAVEVQEAWLDAVTGLSGSGPAYVCLVLEAMSDGGVAAGLPREMSTRLAAQTLLGTARMVLETGQHPGVFKDMVASPGGTTIEGLHQLEKAGVRGAFMNAIRAAAERSRQLGQS